ncbi:MAG: Tat pathway signal protein [Asticcacaulis sp.]
MTSRALSRRAFLSVSAACTLLPLPALAAGPVKKKGGGASYTQLPMITVFTQSRHQKRGTLTVEMGLDTKDEALRQTIAMSLPRLRDAFVRCLQTYALSLNRGSLVDLDYMTQELQAATDEVLKKKGAKVLLSTVLLN